MFNDTYQFQIMISCHVGYVYVTIDILSRGSDVFILQRLQCQEYLSIYLYLYTYTYSYPPRAETSPHHSKPHAIVTDGLTLLVILLFGSRHRIWIYDEGTDTYSRLSISYRKYNTLCVEALLTDEYSITQKCRYHLSCKYENIFTVPECGMNTVPVKNVLHVTI